MIADHIYVQETNSQTQQSVRKRRQAESDSFFSDVPNNNRAVSIFLFMCHLGLYCINIWGFFFVFVSFFFNFEYSLSDKTQYISVKCPFFFTGDRLKGLKQEVYSTEV